MKMIAPIGVARAVVATAPPATLAVAAKTPSASAMTHHPDAALPGAQGGQQVEVWGFDAKLGKDVLLRNSAGIDTHDSIADAAYVNLQKVLAYYHTTFGRSSFDGKGSLIKLRVHSPDAVTGENPANNAYWMNDEHRIWLGDGDGKLFSPLGNAVDIVGHEFTHGVIDSSIQETTGFGQEGALQESWSDVMATGLDNNWQIGETVYTPGVSGDAVRDLEHPVYGKMSDLKPWVDEGHKMADVPNHAAFLVASKVGGDAMRKVWYQALTRDMKDHGGFADARAATILAATRLYGATSSELTAVQQAWDSVGVLATTPKEIVTGGMSSAFALQALAQQLGALRAGR